MRMAARIDVGIDAERDARARLPDLARESIDTIELALGLGIDGLDAEIDRLRQLAPVFCRRPVNTICSGMKPARSATSISPPEFASAPAPSPRSSRAIASVEFAFSA